MVVFVERGLPGQRVLARIEKIAKRHFEAGVQEVLRHGKWDVAPPCPHFGECGGCMWQHLDYAQQLHWKRSFIVEALERLGKVQGVTVGETLPSPRQYAYRNKMEFAFSGQGSDMILGLRPRKGSEVLDTHGCMLMAPPAMAIVATVGELCAQSGIPAWEGDQAQGELGCWRHFVLRHADSEGCEFVGQLITADIPRWKPDILEIMEKSLERHPNLRGISHSVRRSRLPVAMGERLIRTLGAHTCELSLGGLEMTISANSFFQVNTLSADALYGQVRELAAPKVGDLIWDVYCGVGGFGLSLAHTLEGRCKLKGFDISREAIGDARANARALGLESCEFLAGEVKRLLPQERETPNLVVLDPPRTGLAKELVTHLLKRAPQRIVYVSCDPATLARDVGQLLQRYSIARARTVDMFPQTPHVESVVALEVKR